MGSKGSVKKGENIVGGGAVMCVRKIETNGGGGVGENFQYSVIRREGGL